MTEPLSITSRIAEDKGNHPFLFLGPDDETQFELPGRLGLTLIDVRVLVVDFSVGMARVMDKEARQKLLDLKPSLAWMDALNEAYAEHLGLGKGRNSRR